MGGKKCKYSKVLTNKKKKKTFQTVSLLILRARDMYVYVYIHARVCPLVLCKQCVYTVITSRTCTAADDVISNYITIIIIIPSVFHVNDRTAAAAAVCLSQCKTRATNDFGDYCVFGINNNTDFRSRIFIRFAFFYATRSYVGRRTHRVTAIIIRFPVENKKLNKRNRQFSL